MQTEALLEQSQKLAAELQTQQKELQQTNEQLGQKAQQLAEQNAEVERKNQQIEQARRALEEKADELALTSKYKSEFLANMSHELRTPLNCILILGQQLAENPEPNLPPKQVEFARTIHGAGTDLLNLISDILDLSKIESGTVTVEPAEVFFTHLLDTVARPFRHDAETRGLTFDVQLDPRAGPQPHHRPEAPAAGLRTCSPTRSSSPSTAACGCNVSLAAGGWSPSTRCSSRRRHGGRLRGLRHRHRHRAGEAEDHLRGVPAGRRRHQPQVRRHGLGLAISRELAEPARRRDPAAQQRRAWAARSPSTCRSTTSARRLRPARRRGRRRQLRARAGAGRAAWPTRRPEQVPDDRAELAAGRPSLLDRRRRPALRPGARRPRARHRASRCWSRSAAPRRSSWRASSSPTRHLARRVPPRHARVDRAQPPEAGPGDCATFRCRWSPSTRTGSTASRAAPSRSSPSRPPPRASRRRSSSIKEYAEPRRKQAAHRRGQRRRARQHQELLAHDDIDIVTAGTGARGAARCSSTSGIDCMVLDLRLPDISGFEVLSRIATTSPLPDLPVVVFTGKELTPERGRAAPGAGAQGGAQGRGVARAAARRDRAVPPPRHRPTCRPRSRRCSSGCTARDEDLRGRKVLVVDDDVRNIFALGSVLERHGMEVLTAQTGPRGDRHARGHARRRGGADGHHDARDGRVPDHRRSSAKTSGSAACRSSRSPPRR